MASRKPTGPGAAAAAGVRPQDQKKGGEFPFDAASVLGGLSISFHDAIPVLAFPDVESMLVRRFLDYSCGLILGNGQFLVSVIQVIRIFTVLGLFLLDSPLWYL